MREARCASEGDMIRNPGLGGKCSQKAPTDGWGTQTNESGYWFNSSYHLASDPSAIQDFRRCKGLCTCVKISSILAEVMPFSNSSSATS